MNNLFQILNKIFGNIFFRIIGSSLLLIAGFRLIETHQTLFLTLSGITLWGIFISWCVAYIHENTGIPVFSKNILNQLNNSKQIPWFLSLLIGISIFLLLKIADNTIPVAQWRNLIVVLVLIGVLLVFSETRITSLQTNTTYEYPRIKERPWRELLIVVIGSFFLFYHLDSFHRMHGEALNTISVAQSFLKGAATTPYIDTYVGSRYFPSLLLAFGTNLIGFSLLKANAVFAFINLIGFLFFYYFLNFYLSKNSALVTTLLFSASHWVIVMARQTFEGASIVVPFELAALYFFAKAIEKGRPRDYAIFGTVLAFTLMTYLSSRFVVIFFLAATTVIWMTNFREAYRHKKSWALAWGSFALLYSPMVLYFAQIDNGFSWEFIHRTNEVSIVNQCITSHNWTPLWENVTQGIQMFTFSTSDTLSTGFPFLSPWEGLCFFAGLSWCIWKFYKPAFFILLMGLLGGMCLSVLTSLPTHLNRVLAASPFVYTILGIGLDRLACVISAPLGKNIRWTSTIFVIVLLFFSFIWQYDTYFNQFPKSRTSWSVNGTFYLAGQTIASYPSDWDVYTPPEMGFSYDYFYSSKEKVPEIHYFSVKTFLPITEIPAKGILLLLPNDLGQALEDWIHFYYPNTKPKLIQNPFGDVEFWSYEITPSQVQNALKLRGQSPPNGLKLSWYDIHNRLMGRCLVPSLTPGLKYWFGSIPGQPNFPGSISYLIAKGEIRSLQEEPLYLLPGSEADWSLGNQKAHVKYLGNTTRVRFKPTSKGWIPLSVRNQPLGDNYTFSLYRLDPTGWALVPSSDLRP